MENTTQPISNHIDDAIVVTVWTVMLLYGLIANCLIEIGIYRSPSMRTSTSYWFIISLSVCDIFMILISIAHIIPATAFHDNFVKVNSLRNIWAIFFYDLFWYTGVLILGLMAVNRFVSIVYPTRYQRLFSRQRTAYVIGGLYTVGLLVSLPTLFPCCHTVYDHNYYVTTYDPVDSLYFIIDVLVNSFSVILMIFCYAVILAKVRNSRKAMTRYRLNVKRRSRADATNGAASVQRTSKKYTAIEAPPTSALSSREVRLFIQFFIVSLVFLLTWSTWQWLPRISASKWVYFTLTSFFFINNGVNPTVYLIFNSSLRSEVRAVLRIRQPSSNHVRSNSGSKDKHEPDRLGSARALRPVPIASKSPSCNSTIGLLRAKEYPLSPSSVSTSGLHEIQNYAGCRVTMINKPAQRQSRSGQTSPVSLRDMRSPDALLGDSFREFMSPETIQDDSTATFSFRKEVSGIPSIADSEFNKNDSMVNLISPLTTSSGPPDPLTPVVQVNAIPGCARVKYEPKILEVVSADMSGSNQVIMELMSSDSNWDPQDFLEPISEPINKKKLTSEVSEPRGCNLAAGNPTAPLAMVRDRSLSATDWASAASQSALIPIFSKDDDLFIYTSTV